MSKFTITIIGTGVIGTSLGLALKQQEDPPQLIAHDKDLTLASQAVKMGAFDKAEWNLINACEPADMIILAIPLSGVHATLEAMAPYLKQNAVISDTCPSKQAVLTMANNLLPDHVHFVGGNPVVHPAGAGHAHARADLFQDQVYCLTPTSSTNEEAVQLLAGFVSLVGANPFFLDPVEHDGLLSAVEHLPSLLSVILVNTLSRQGTWRESSKLAGGLFEQVSFGAKGDPDGLKDNFLENREVLLHWVDQYMLQLQEFKNLLAAKEDTAEEMAQTIDEAVVTRLNWQKDYREGRFIEPELVSQKIEMPGFWQRMVGFGGFRKRGSDNDKS